MTYINVILEIVHVHSGPRRHALAQSVLPLVRVFLYLFYNRPQVHSDSAHVHVFHMTIQIADDIFEKEQFLLVFVNLVKFLYIFFARLLFVERPKMVIFMPSGKTSKVKNINKKSRKR